MLTAKQFTPENVVEKTREFLSAVQESGTAGALLWSMYFHHRDGGFYWHQMFTYPSVWSYHWPGFPSAEAQREIGIMRVMREAAFKIQGLPVPPVPVPDAPELLPIGNVPLLSWRGSAGASGYDVERAPAAERAVDPHRRERLRRRRGLPAAVQRHHGPRRRNVVLSRHGAQRFRRVAAVQRRRAGESRSGSAWPTSLQDFSRVPGKSDGPDAEQRLQRALRRVPVPCQGHRRRLAQLRSARSHRNP